MSLLAGATWGIGVSTTIPRRGSVGGGSWVTWARHPVVANASSWAEVAAGRSLSCRASSRAGTSMLSPLAVSSAVSLGPGRSAVAAVTAELALVAPIGAARAGHVVAAADPLDQLAAARAPTTWPLYLLTVYIFQKRSGPRPAPSTPRRLRATMLTTQVNKTREWALLCSCSRGAEVNQQQQILASS